ncbi:MAG TPA: winged helix-turn-helix domain-containing protein [Gaiellaceae bacterium]|nr:winged helix-turn-helix domain-containing protein [Gaiellaceae bacterium]
MPGTGEIGTVFDALGDPGRRALVASVADRGTATATELAAELPVTRQAVAKQLGALADAGLLRATRVGRETRYAVTPQPLGDAAAWLVEIGGHWDERLAALGRSVARARAARPPR